MAGVDQLLPDCVDVAGIYKVWNIIEIWILYDFENYILLKLLISTLLQCTNSIDEDGSKEYFSDW